MKIVVPAALPSKGRAAPAASQESLRPLLVGEPVLLDPITLDVVEGEPWPEDCCCDCTRCRAAHPDE